MAIDPALKAKILRYHFVEHWGVNTIARQLGIHHSSVDRVLAQAGLPKAERSPRPSIVDPYHPMIIQTLADWRRWTESHLTGAFLCTRAAVPLLRARRGAWDLERSVIGGTPIGGGCLKIRYSV